MSMIDEIRSKLAAQDLERYLRQQRELLARRSRRSTFDFALKLLWLASSAFAGGFILGMGWR